MTWWDLTPAAVSLLASLLTFRALHGRWPGQR